MRRWPSLALQRHSTKFKIATTSFLSFRKHHQFALLGRAPNQPSSLLECSVWHQSRLYTEESVASAVSKQSSNSDWQHDLELPSRPNEGFEDLLSEGARYFIHDVRALEFESSVNSHDGRSSRLVEQPKYQFDYELWAILLGYRMRVYGDTGIKTIWSFLTRRDRLRMLPTCWPLQDSLWSVFLNLGLRDHEFLKRVAKHAKQLWRERKLRRPSLYVEAVGGLLRSENSAAAASFSESMHPGVSIESKELLELFRQACSSADSRGLDHFWLICDSVPNHNIYGGVISTLCEQERIAEAVTMHTHLIRRHDCPTTFDEIVPLVRRIARDGLDLPTFICQLEKANISFSGRVQRLYDSVKKSEFGISREDIELATSRTFGVRRSKISDAFAAKFFATKSISFDFALNGLYMLGLEEIGPLSLREIALQGGTAEGVQKRLAKLDNMGIDTGGSVYSRVIRKLAQEEEHLKLMDVVHCDQHPDVFEDLQVQSQLLIEYHQAKDWRQFNRTLAVLSIYGNSAINAPNGMLLSALMRKDWPEVTKVTTQMYQAYSQIRRANLMLMYQSILRPRIAVKRAPVGKYGFYDLEYLISLWQNSLHSGTDIPSDAWREPLRRLGMMGRWSDLEKACIWLCSFYSQQQLPSATNNFNAHVTIFPVGPASRKRGHLSVLNEVFSPALQRAIVEWGFLAGLQPYKCAVRSKALHLEKSRILHKEPWILGIELLCNLQRRYGVHLHDLAIRLGCEERLRQLFSRGRRSKRLHNREAKILDKAKLSHYIDRINSVYRHTLLDPTNPRTWKSILLKRRARRVKGKRCYFARKGEEEEVSVDENDFMMYRDVFHASLEDYRARTPNNKG